MLSKNAWAVDDSDVSQWFVIGCVFLCVVVRAHAFMEQRSQKHCIHITDTNTLQMSSTHTVYKYQYK